jgi:2'-5' RNA ligase
MDQRVKAAGYAIWLMPTGPAYRHLARRILALSRQYSTPRFEPHVTLLSGIALPEEDAVNRCAALARLLEPFEVRLGAIDFSDEFFRCLFFHVMPADAVIRAHQQGGEVFGLRTQPPYMPHLSLMYGSLPAETRKRLAADPPSGLSFQASRLYLYSVNGPPEDWRPAGSFSLG